MAGQIPVTRGGHVFQETERYFLMADLAVLQRDEAALRQYAPLAEEMALQDNHRLYEAGAHRAWGVLHQLTGEYAQAESRLNRALELFKEMETRWQIGRTLSELARLELAQANPAQAKQYYSQALVLFEQIGAKPDVERARKTIASLT